MWHYRPPQPSIKKEMMDKKTKNYWRMKSSLIISLIDLGDFCKYAFNHEL